MFPRRVHALPEAFVTIGGQLALPSALGQRVRFQNAIGIIQIALDKLSLQNHEAAVDVTGAGLWLLREAGDQTFVQLDFAKSASGMDGRDSRQLAGSFVEI